MIGFRDFMMQQEWFGGSANDPSNVEDEGDGGDGVEKRMAKPGAYPTYSDDERPITDRNRRSSSRPQGSGRNIFGRRKSIRRPVGDGERSHPAPGG